MKGLSSQAEFNEDCDSIGLVNRLLEQVHKYVSSGFLRFDVAVKTLLSDARD